MVSNLSEKEKLLSSGRIAEILPKQLYISDMTVALNFESLTLLGITHIVNATNRHVPNQFEDSITYFNVDIEDSEVSPLTPWFSPTFGFIDEALTHSDSKVLVHCMCGISRSGSLIIGYLIHHNPEKSLKSVFHSVKKMRPTISPNPLFAENLRSLEMNLRSKPPTITVADMVNPNYQRTRVNIENAKSALDRMATDDSSSCFS